MNQCNNLYTLPFSEIFLSLSRVFNLFHKQYITWTVFTLTKWAWCKAGLGYKLEFSNTLKTQLKGSNFADKCLMIAGVSSYTKAFSETSTLPPLLGGIVSLAFFILFSQEHPPRRNTAVSILMPARFYSCWEALVGHCGRSAEERGRSPNSAVFGACFALPLIKGAACLCVIRPVLCNGPKCKDLWVHRCLCRAYCSGVTKTSVLLRTALVHPLRPGTWLAEDQGDTPALLLIPDLPWLRQLRAFLHFIKSSHDRLQVETVWRGE